ncbi:hypothetical protein BDU57DRAFT_353820 [Ampelomyces quisqualis]|uniref:Secreted protein n=1 Tax=Ampelomyces quisqualis TaxID=50730 RepID=A0A6A5QDF7_AMPQU|nr:hypothetical protein BDU57DRAFT_353820 [Ampelomyces quisqualis]
MLSVLCTVYAAALCTAGTLTQKFPTRKEKHCLLPVPLAPGRHVHDPTLANCIASNPTRPSLADSDPLTAPWQLSMLGVSGGFLTAILPASTKSTLAFALQASCLLFA